VAPGELVHVAVRVGAGAGIAVVAPREDERVAVIGRMLPAPVGSRVPLAEVEAELRRLCETYDVVSVAYDPDQFRRSAEILVEEGLPMDEVPQRVTRLARATATLWRLVSAGLLAHDGDPELRAQVLAGRTKETTQGWHLEPTASTSALIALAVACHEATKVPPSAPMVVAL
jgi:phage terminase large subunit-like protein